jgi:deoxyribodipyrimidine photo-lyase
MNKSFQLSLHIFRRDLRLHDNTALHAALTLSKKVIPCFIFDPRQLEENPFKNTHAIQFMWQSLSELNHALAKHHSHLYCFHGMAEEVVHHLLTKIKIDAVFINRDYTPFSLKRDKALQTRCQQNNIAFHCMADALLLEPEEITQHNHQPYTVFTHFFNKAKQLPVNAPEKACRGQFFNEKISGEDNKLLHAAMPLTNECVQPGGRQAGLTLLKKIPSFAHYATTRDYPAKNGTTHLSPHLKFGTISIREAYQTISHHFNPHHTLIKELYWRDFFTHIAFHYPHVFETSFNKKYTHLPWDDNPAYFAAWCHGQTGFPIVDAGMKELNTTGYMHNRVRMIVASFLVKDLHLNWQQGERYFATQLTDYDPAVNNGNWQWAASTGCDAQPYFRIFNPWLQQAKFDPNCEYIKQWLPELINLPAKTIHHWYQLASDATIHYPAPIVNHQKERLLALQLFKACR